jgi:hypothetical protein
VLVLLWLRPPGTVVALIIVSGVFPKVIRAEPQLRPSGSTMETTRLLLALTLAVVTASPSSSSSSARAIVVLERIKPSARAAVSQDRR